MRLQHKVFTFLLPSGDKPISRLLTSSVLVNNNKSDILMSDLFHSIKKEKGNTIKGWSFLEVLNEKGEVDIDGKIYALSFQTENEVFNLSNVSDPTDFVLNDKETSEEEDKFIEKRIIDSVPAIDDSNQQPDSEASDSQESAGTQSVLFENEDYEYEKKENEKDGYVEYNTNPKSNFRLLVQEAALPEKPEDDYEKIVVIEIEEDDFAILDREDFKLELNPETKTFSYALAVTEASRGVEKVVEN